jgi:hypothetical protein
MTGQRCGICEAADRDLGIVIGSMSVTPSQVTHDRVVAAYTRLGPWVDHVLRDASDAPAHLEELKLPNLSGTAYVGNVLRAANDPTLMDDPMFNFNPSLRAHVIAAALVLLLTGVHMFAAGAHRDVSERIARSWGWSG